MPDSDKFQGLSLTIVADATHPHAATTTIPAPTVPPNHPGFVLPIPFSPRQDHEIETAVEKFAIDLKEAFNVFLNDNIQLPLWHPPSNLDIPVNIRTHIAALKIPTLSPSSQFPLLLLHNLGEESHDALLDGRVEGLFHPDSK